MLAGCSSSSLLSPRHRLKSESTQACHFQLPSSMNTQRLDLPCSNFSRKDTATSARPQQQSVRPKPVEANRSLKQHIRLPPLATTTAATATSAFVEVKGEFWEGGGGGGGNRRSLKRSVDDDESCIGRAKRKKQSDEFGQLGGIGNAFWFGDEEEEERVCFVTGDRVPPLSGINWVGFGEKEVETSHGHGERGRASASPSSASSESQSLVLRLNEVGTEVVGGASRSSPLEGSQSRQVAEVETHHKEFELVSVLISCVEAVASKNIPAINHFIAKLGDLASPVGPTALSRLTAYYTEALALRVSRLWPHIFHITTPREVDRAEDELGTALRVLNQVTPIPKFIHFTANEILLRAFEGKERVHIIDFDIKQGLQWPSLFQSLASRTPHPPRHVRITGIGDSKQELIETGARLSGFAEALNLEFEFHPVVDRIEDVRLWMLHVKEGESVAVNCVLQLHKTLYDATGQSLRDFLGLVRSTNPAVLVVAEQEVDNNSVLLESRIVSSLQYYCALFDSVASAPPGARARVEEMFGREIRNVVACEGSDRIERHERFDLWEKSMERVGVFRGLEISEREKLQVEMLLRMYGDEGFRVMRVGSGITLSFEDQPLYTVSAWVPVDHHIGASSSSFSQLS